MEGFCEDKDRDKENSGNNVVRQLSPSLVRESLIIFDWDDTVLPTSWLERIRALTAGVPMRPEVARQMAALAAACSTTLQMASQMGTLVFITNSAPGWVDQSCQLFMPQIYQQVRSYQIFAKPMHAPLTFKINVFRRECQQFRNICSVGDGDAERAASLRLLGPSDRRPMPIYGEQRSNERCVKSVKLIEFPSCQQLIAEQEMLQTRLADIVNYQGSLDLKARFPATSFTSPLSQAKPSGCTLVHFARAAGPMMGPSSAPMRLGGTSSAPSPAGSPMRASTTTTGSPNRQPTVDENVKMEKGLMMLRSLPAPQFRQPVGGTGGFNGTMGGQLPPLGVATGERNVSDKGGSGTDEGNQSTAGGIGSGGESGIDVHPAGALDDNAEHGTGAGEKERNPNTASGIWKMHGSPGARSPYTQGAGKKRPVLASGSPGQGLSLRSRSPGAVWAGAAAGGPGR